MEQEWGSNPSSPEKGSNAPSGVQSAWNVLEEDENRVGEEFRKTGQQAASEL